MTRLESLHCFHIIYHPDNITNPKGVELQEKESHKLLGDEARGKKEKKEKNPTISPSTPPPPPENPTNKKPIYSKNQGITKHKYNYQKNL